MSADTGTFARRVKTNRLGLEKSAYKGRPSTLCKGCGDNSINNAIMKVAWELGLDQTKVVKISGIGCSSKSIAYFMSRSHGFNGLHGRMPVVATGGCSCQVSSLSGSNRKSRRSY